MVKFLFFINFCVALLLCASCDNKKIAQVVKELSEAPVSTQGFSEKVIATAPFSAIEVECFADVTFHQTDAETAPKVVLKAPHEVLPNLIAEVEYNRLKFRINSRYRMPEKSVVAVDVYAPYINRLILNGGKCLRLGRLGQSTPLLIEVNGTVGAVTADTLEVPELTLRLNGSGSIDLKNLNVPRLRAAIDGTGVIVLDGHAEETMLKTAGGGKFQTEGLHKK